MFARNLVSGRMDYWIDLETAEEIYTLHWTEKPFVGTQAMVDAYVEHLALHAMAKGLPLISINVYPIKRAS